MVLLITYLGVICRSMWTYLEGSFLDGIYNEVWYNDGDSQ